MEDSAVVGCWDDEAMMLMGDAGGASVAWGIDPSSPEGRAVGISKTEGSADGFGGWAASN
ncbi:MAG: hypothetical protein AUJ55_04440 [Proteobacteria bacterium CG1_02_64_396]|nr:MAG: hypothetical protein AUJ55_04440 [Proteobacteria bacterium CG1_02_64_396]